jgi:hypothetical protein
MGLVPKKEYFIKGLSSAGSASNNENLGETLYSSFSELCVYNVLLLEGFFHFHDQPRWNLAYYVRL